MNSGRYPRWTGECGVHVGLGQCIADLGHDRIRPAKHVSSCKAEQPDIGQQQAILATIVLDEAGAMSVAVVFKTQPVLAVVEVGASQE